MPQYLYKARRISTFVLWHSCTVQILKQYLDAHVSTVLTKQGRILPENTVYNYSKILIQGSD